MMGMTDVRCGPKLNRRKLTEYQDTRAGVLRLWFWLRNLSVVHLTLVRHPPRGRSVARPKISCSIPRQVSLLSQSQKVAASSWGRAGRARSGLGRGGVGM